jgi:hypothetical protein
MHIKNGSYHLHTIEKQIAINLHMIHVISQKNNINLRKILGNFEKFFEKKV